MIIRLALAALYFVFHSVLAKTFVRDLPSGVSVEGRSGYVRVIEDVETADECIDTWYYERMKVVMFEREEKRCTGYQIVTRVLTGNASAPAGYFLSKVETRAICSANVMADLHRIVECKPDWFRIIMPNGTWCYHVMESSEYNATGTITDSHSIEHSCSRLYKGAVCASIHNAAQERIIISESQLYSPELEGIILGMCPANTAPQKWTHWTDGSPMDYTNWSVAEDIEKTGCVEKRTCSSQTPVLMFHGTPDWVLDDPLAGRPILCQYKA